MSYILDALKKAERERDIKQVPTLMAAHDTPSVRRKSLWTSVVFSVVLVAAGFGYILLLKQTASIPAPSPTAPPPAQTREKPEAPQAQAASGNDAPASKQEPESSIGKSVNKGGIKQPQSEAGQVSQDSDEGPAEIQSPVHVPELRQSLSPRGRAIAERMGLVAPEPAEPESVPLREALSKMTLSLLVYDENPADRMVFINGQKYVEGDIVEGAYLLERITLEGATLSYRGERALLKPKSR